MLIKKLRRGMKAPEGDVGIELEVEGVNLPRFHDQGRGPVPISNYWSIVHDGSLRDGAEYILTAPISAAKVPDALDEMKDLFEAHETRPKYSFRTSTHVHINVNNMEFEHVLNYIYLYGLVENVITKMCGANRIGNRFCLRMSDAEGVIDAVSDLIKMRASPFPHLAMWEEGAVKYAAVNLYVLSKYGSLEFRAMEGTDDWQKLLTWISTLLHLRKAAQTYEAIPSVFEDLNKLGVKEFFYKILGKNADHFWNDAAENEILSSASITYDLVLASLRTPKAAEGGQGGVLGDPWGMLEEFPEKVQASLHEDGNGYRFVGAAIAHECPWIIKHLQVRNERGVPAFYYVLGATAREAFIKEQGEF